MDDASRNSPLPRAFLVGAVLLGLALRVAFGLLYWTGQPLTRDEREYLSLARSLAAGNGFVYDDVMRSGPFTPFGRAPGYPVFLAAVGGGRSVVETVPAAVKIAQSVVGGFGIVLIGVIAHRLAGVRASKAAALIAAAYPPLIWIAAFAWSEAVFWPVGLLIVWVFDRLMTKPDRIGAAMLCGLLIGAGILIRPALIFFVPLAVLYALWQRRPKLIAGLAIGTLVIVGPWTARNVQHYGRFVLVASEGGVTFWTGNHPLAVGDGDLAANPRLKEDNLRLRAEHPGLSEEEMERFYYEEAFAWMRTHPVDWLRLEARKAFYLVVPAGPSYALHSARYRVTSVVAYLALLALACLGLARGRANLRRAAGLWLLAASAVAVCLVFFPQERFRIPIVDPVLVVLGGLGVASLVPVKPHL
jgi:4-amino-4-deoxy-L-arabinose transferase-like glycosyltransferase